MPAQINDSKLITHFIQGDAVLLSNYRLYIQSVHNLCQLFTSKGQLIAWARHKASPPQIGVRALGEYADVLREMLLDYEYIPLRLNRSGQFMEYEYRPRPDGYQSNFTEAKALWTYWWRNRRCLVGTDSPYEVMVFVNGCWSAVVDIAFQTETLFITAYHGEMAAHLQDRLAWLQPKSASDDDKLACLVKDWINEQRQPSSKSTHQLQITPEKKHRFQQATQPQTREGAGLSKMTPFNHVYRLSEHKLIVETPHGQVVICGDCLTVQTEDAADPLSMTSQ